MTAVRGEHLIGKEIGSCILERVLGCGGSSVVFLAQQRSPERKVAVKVFLPRANLDQQVLRNYYERFLHEAETASKLDHPNVLPIYAYGEQDGLPYIVMPYMSRGTLSEYVAQHGPLSLLDAQWYLEQIASALTHLHEQGWIHCDIKPANILIDEEEHAMLTDFGIAQKVQSLHPTEQGNFLMGTPDYISPEQAMGAVLDSRSDIYSLGVAFFFLLTGQLPFKASTTIAVALMHVHDRPPRLTSLRADIPSEIDTVLQRALEKKPERRFATPLQFSEAFTEAVNLYYYREQREQKKRSKRLLQAVAPPAVPEDEQPTLDTGDQISLPARKRITPARVVSLLSLLLVVIIGGFAGALLYPRLFTVPEVKATPTPLPMYQPATGEALDLLTSCDSWPTSGSFFYDSRSRAYHVLNRTPQNVPVVSLCPLHSFRDFRLQVEMKQIKSPKNGRDNYGVIFRSDPGQSHYYLFEILGDGSGQYAFYRYEGKWNPPLALGAFPDFKPGLQQANTLTIEARNNTFIFALNGRSLGPPVVDPGHTAPAAGLIGFFVEANGVEVAFSKVMIESRGAGR